MIIDDFSESGAGNQDYSILKKQLSPQTQSEYSDGSIRKIYDDTTSQQISDGSRSNHTTSIKKVLQSRRNMSSQYDDSQSHQDV